MQSHRRSVGGAQRTEIVYRCIVSHFTTVNSQLPHDQQVFFLADAMLDQFYFRNREPQTNGPFLTFLPLATNNPPEI